MTSILITRDAPSPLPSQPSPDIYEHDTLMETFRDLARLKCLNSKLSGAWVGCIPVQRLGLKIGNIEFVNLLKFRLGIPVIPCDMAGSPCPRCDAAVDVFGDHFLVCKNAGFWHRHNLVCDVLSQELTSYGIQHEVEKSFAGLERPADIWIPHWANSPGLAVDVTVVHCIPDARQVEKAEEYKRTHYAHLFATTGGAQFTPCGFGTLGQPGSGAKALLQQLKAYASTHHCSKSTHLGVDVDTEQVQLKTKLSMAIAKSMGRCLCAAQDLIAMENTKRRPETMLSIDQFILPVSSEDD